MDAKEFVKDIRRMCEYYKDCVECPNRECGYCSKSGLLADDEAEEIVSVVEKWVKEHPTRTRKDELLEKYPDVWIAENGNPKICPKYLFRTNHNAEFCCSTTCFDCMKEFWGEEI